MVSLLALIKRSPERQVCVEFSNYEPTHVLLLNGTGGYLLKDMISNLPLNK